MTTLSLRRIAEENLGKTGDLSVNVDVYGYRYRNTEGLLFGFLDEDAVLPWAGDAAVPTRRSLRRHLETISGTGIDVVMFLVGHRPDFSGFVTPDQAANLQYAVQVTRDLWAQRDFGLRRLEWGYLTPEQAGDRVFISSVFGAMQLTHKVSGRPGAIDLFAVQRIEHKDGWGPMISGPCDKTNLFNMNGCVLDLDNSPQWLGISIAHETGHYLGLGHVTDQQNVMHGPHLFAEVNPTSAMVNLTEDQVEEMTQHCIVVQR